MKKEKRKKGKKEKRKKGKKEKRKKGKKDLQQTVMGNRLVTWVHLERLVDQGPRHHRFCRKVSWGVFEFSLGGSGSGSCQYTGCGSSV